MTLRSYGICDTCEAAAKLVKFFRQNGGEFSKIDGNDYFRKTDVVVQTILQGNSSFNTQLADLGLLMQCAENVIGEYSKVKKRVCIIAEGKFSFSWLINRIQIARAGIKRKIVIEENIEIITPLLNSHFVPPLINIIAEYMDKPTSRGDYAITSNVKCHKKVKNKQNSKVKKALSGVNLSHNKSITFASRHLFFTKGFQMTKSDEKCIWHT